MMVLVVDRLPTSHSRREESCPQLVVDDPCALAYIADVEEAEEVPVEVLGRVAFC